MSPSLWSAVDLRAGQQPAAMLGELSSKQTASLQVSGTEPGTPRSGEKTFWRGGALDKGGARYPEDPQSKGQRLRVVCRLGGHSSLLTVTLCSFKNSH